MNRDQWTLFQRLNPTWTALWLICDFESARQHITASIHGGSDFETGSWCETTRKGLNRYTFGPDGEHVVTVELPWSTIKDWSLSQSDATREEARRLSAIGQEIATSFPSAYPSGDDSLGRPYAWDTDPRGSDDEIAADRAWLDDWQKRRNARRTQHSARSIAHDSEVRQFVESLAPSEEPNDLLELLAAMA